MSRRGGAKNSERFKKFEIPEFQKREVPCVVGDKYWNEQKLVYQTVRQSTYRGFRP